MATAAAAGETVGRVDERIARRLRAAAAVAAAAVALIGAVGLVGAALGVPWLMQPLGWLPAIAPLTGVALLCAAFALALVRCAAPSPGARAAAGAAAAGMIAIAAGTLIDLAVERRSVVTGLLHRPAPNTAIALALLGAALLLIDRRSRRDHPIAEALAAIAGAIPLLTLVGYIHRAQPLYALERALGTGMAPQTAAALLLLAAGILCARPERGFASAFASAGAGGYVVRRLVAVAFAIPVAGVLAMAGRLAGLYDVAVAAALSDVAAMFVAMAVVVATGRRLDEADRARRAALARAEHGEERLRTLVEHASDGIFVADLGGRYSDVNAAGCRMLGYTRDEIVGRTIVDLIPPEDVPRLAEARAHLLGGVVEVDEWTLRRKDGRWLPVEVSAKILSDGRWQGMVRDISARKEAERAREASYRASIAVSDAAAEMNRTGLGPVLQTIVEQARRVTGAEIAGLALAGDEPWLLVGAPREPPRLGATLAVPIQLRGSVLGHIYLADKRGAARFDEADQRGVEAFAARAASAVETARLYQA